MASEKRPAVGWGLGELGGSPLAAILVAALYVAAAKLGFTMAFPAPQVTVVWPPTGIALAAVLLLGRRIWPGIALGAFLANVTAPNETVATACGIATGNTLEALVGAWALERAGFHPALDRLRDVLALVVRAALGSTAVSATIGVTTLCLGGTHPWAAFAKIWWVWWVGDAIGDLVMAPLLLVLATAPPIRVRPQRVAEAMVLAAALFVVSVTLFAGRSGMPMTGYPLHYTIFPFVIWSALRFGQRGSTSVTFAAAAVTIWSTTHGSGPFAMTPPHESLTLLQLFMAVVAVSALLLGAAIAEREAAEHRGAADYARLQASEERLRLALEAGRMGVWDWDVATGAITWSDSLEPIHGLARGAFPGTLEGFQALVHPEDRERVNRAITHALEEGGGYDVEFRNLRPDGTVHWIAGKGTAVRDPAGRAVRMLGVGMDVTGRRRLEEELRQRAAQLADADRRKDEFLAMLAHELRNPLQPLTNALHLLGRSHADKERFLAMASRQVTHLVRLVDDLLDVSRITQGKITLRKEPVRLSELVAQAVETVRPSIEPSGHSVSVSLPAEPLQLDADPARLAQVLANLLSNAAKYTPPGGSIWLTAERAGDQVAIRVRDTGAGIDPELLPHVFDLFVQGDTPADRAPGGLGIGLTIVRRLVEMHGGRVEAHSAGGGRGSEFIVWLPASPPSFGEAIVPRDERKDAAPPRGLRVLVVEDNRDSAESLAEMLGLWGHQVHIAFDGVAALELAERHRPDLVLSDIGLPGMDGYELARRLRDGRGPARAVLVALTGYGRDDDKRRALEAGFDHHLVKPPDMGALEELLRRVTITPAAEREQTLH